VLKDLKQARDKELEQARSLEVKVSKVEELEVERRNLMKQIEESELNLSCVKKQCQDTCL